MKIPPGVWDSIELPNALKSYTAFISHFGVEVEEEQDSMPAALPEFAGGETGCPYELPDGVTVHVRMQRIAGIYQPQWCQLCSNRYVVNRACIDHRILSST